MNPTSGHKCPICNRSLPVSQVRIMAEESSQSGYTEWFLNGYCSFACYSGKSKQITLTSTQSGITDISALDSISPPNANCAQETNPTESKRSMFSYFILGIALLLLAGLFGIAIFKLTGEPLNSYYYLPALGFLISGIVRILIGFYHLVSFSYLSIKAKKDHPAA